jgi:hypothetical protein
MRQKTQIARSPSGEVGPALMVYYFVLNAQVILPVSSAR